MPCYRIKIDGMGAGLMCVRGTKSPKPCCYCGDVSDVLCDFPVSKTPGGRKKTCDAPMCSDCSQKGVSENVDFCKVHYPKAKAAYEKRQAASV